MAFRQSELQIEIQAVDAELQEEHMTQVTLLQKQRSQVVASLPTCPSCAHAHRLSRILHTLSRQIKEAVTMKFVDLDQRRDAELAAMVTTAQPSVFSHSLFFEATLFPGDMS